MLCKLINANNQLSSGGLFTRFATITNCSKFVINSQNTICCVN